MDIKETVKDYYGKELKESADLKTNACCTVMNYPKHIKDTMAKIHDEVHQKYYGCGLTIPTTLEGLKVLDLGSGAGRDCFILSNLVGEEGNVIGVDMTEEQLAVANRHIEYHANQFGHKKPNVTFLKGDIEKLDELDIQPGSLDLIVSNCVINLAEDKKKVLKDAYNLLKVGGEMYFSDVYADRRVPKHLQQDRDLWGECLSGALYWNDFLNYSKEAGFTDPRAVENAVITVENKELQEKLRDIKFYSVTYRLFKLKGLEPECEDYGQSVIYKGTIKEMPETFILDSHHKIKKDVEFKVCGNTYKMLNETRFKKHFEFKGDFSTHLGIFEGCGTSMPFDENSTKGASCC